MRQVSRRSIELIPLGDFPIVQPNDDIAELILSSLANAGLQLIEGDVLVIAQKIVSKAENRYVKLSDIVPSGEAQLRAAQCRKDPRLVEVILRESVEVLRCKTDILIVSHRLGFVVPNAAIDASNVEQSQTSDRVLLLPMAPDISASSIRASLELRCRARVGIIINDSFGRAWRVGTIGTAIGASGLPSLEDLRGQRDLFGRVLTSTEVATADQLASAASILQGQADEGTPVVLIRGFSSPSPAVPASALVRPLIQDLFR